jgi:glycerophosphoryl diester phosphodiesterase
MIELDCRLTRDGEVVVLHDATLTRLWGDPRRLSELDWDELGSLHQDGYRVPRLAEVLEALPLPVMVDLPDPAAAAASWVVARSAGAAERCMFAGNTAGLEQLRTLSPYVRIALTWDKPELPSPQLLGRVKPEWWNPYFRLADAASVEWAHGRGMGVSVWTVDNPRDIAWALDAGVDAVISNQVARVVEELAGRRAPATGPNP